MRMTELTDDKTKTKKGSFHLTDDGRAEKAGDVVPLDAILIPFVQNIKSKILMFTSKTY